MPSLNFPWPPKQLFPNWKRSHHWSSYSKLARNARTLGWGLTVAELGAAGVRSFKPDTPLKVWLKFTPPMRPGSPPDADNTLGACKHYLDGISSALGVDDKHFRIAGMELLDREGDGAVVVSF